ncbi:MAG: hypothetical protein ACRCXZ_00740 [Patescibacteria group bacterium]
MKTIKNKAIFPIIISFAIWLIYIVFNNLRFWGFFPSDISATTRLVNILPIFLTGFFVFFLIHIISYFLLRSKCETEGIKEIPKNIKFIQYSLLFIQTILEGSLINSFSSFNNPSSGAEYLELGFIIFAGIVYFYHSIAAAGFDGVKSYLVKAIMLILGYFFPFI